MAAVRTPRSSWVEEGLRALAAGGPEAIRVEPLAKSLGVTKGGFYWHFEDRPALLEAVLDHWEKASVEEVIERIEGEAGGDPRDRLRRLFALAGERHDLREADFAVREWARRDPGVAARLERVDGRRLEYMRSLFAEFCPDPDEVEARCLLLVSLWVGGRLVVSPGGGRARGRVIGRAQELLLAGPGVP